MPSQRQYQGICEWTATRGAAMPKRWRSFSSGRCRMAPPHQGTTGDLVEARGLRQAEHEVHVLHRLARGALHQVVDHREHDQRVAAAALSGGRCTAMRQTFAARTERVSGWLPAGMTSTNGSLA